MNSGNLTLFVGAGISRESGGPNFLALRNLFMRPLIGDDTDEVSEDVVSPELLFGALDDGRRETLRSIRRELWWECEPHHPGRTHHAVAALLADGARAWTTNFDTLIERAADRCGIQVTVKTEPLGRPDGPTLVKVHGSFPRTGEPITEPLAHDYLLRFRSADVWSPLTADWIKSLTTDIERREVHFFGYRGADLDLVPALIYTLPRAQRVVWWEMPGTTNLDSLRQRFGTMAEISSGNPSEALVALGADAMRRWPMRESNQPLPGPRPKAETVRTYTAKAALEGQFRGAATARRRLASAVLLDPPPLKKPALLRLIRSSGFDRPQIGGILLRTLDLVARATPAVLPERLWDVYAAILDAQPVSSLNTRTANTLLRSPNGDDPQVTVRVASFLKRLGALAQAEMLLRAALAELGREESASPLLEAMAVYNLLWVTRQRWEPEVREKVRARLAERSAHIGFNWAAWLALDDAAYAMQTGDVSNVGNALQSPFVSFACARLHHPMFLGELELVKSLDAWGAGRLYDAATGLESILRIVARPDGRLTFTAVDSLILSADLARVQGNHYAVRHHLARATVGTASPLQVARIRLVRCLADEDTPGLQVLAERANNAGHGLVATCATGLVRSSLQTICDSDGILHWQPDLPLPALY